MALRRLMQGLRARFRRGVLAALTFVGLTPGLTATQEPASGEGWWTGPTLDRSHWAVAAVRRADALSLIEMYLPAQNALPLEVVERGLREARAASVGQAPWFETILEDWYLRLLEEYPGLDTLRIGAGRGTLLGAQVGVGFIHRSGGAAPGFGEFEPDRTGAMGLPDYTRPRSVQEVAARWGEHLALRIASAGDADGISIERLEVAVAAGRFRASAGRTPVGYAHGFGGGVLLTGDAALDVVQVGTRAPFLLPGFLRRLGPASVHTFLGKMWDDRHPDDPFTWGASGQLRPHDRVILGVHRAAFFGGKPDQPVTLERILDMLIGRVAGIGFENQIVSVSGRWSLPTEQIVPLEAYLEWGAEDAAGAWFDVPGRVMGLWSPALPFWPAAAAGIEYASLATSCCSNPSWYRHWSFPGSWASGDKTLGHRVGGDGNELMTHLAAELVGGHLHIRAEVFRRNRREENLYSPGRTGASWGGGLAGFLVPASHLRIEFGGAVEAGEGWTQTDFGIQGVIHF